MTCTPRTRLRCTASAAVPSQARPGDVVDADAVYLLDGLHHLLGQLGQAITPAAGTDYGPKSRALVHRTQDSADHRRVLLHISDFGLELLDAPERDLRQYYSALEARLGPRGVTRLNRLLQSLT